MAWFARPTTAHERATYSRLRQVYLLLKRWKENLPELPLAPWPELAAEELDEALGAESSEELLTRLKRDLRATLESWDRILADPAKRTGPVWGRLLRLTEEEAVRYTSAQWKDAGESLFHSVPEVFAAYRETPFATLFRESHLLRSSRSDRVEFHVRHPGTEIEAAWMRGFTTVLRPRIQLQTSESSPGMKTFQWID